jgi:hypothetical protein
LPSPSLATTASIIAASSATADDYHRHNSVFLDCSKSMGPARLPPSSTCPVDGGSAANTLSPPAARSVDFVVKETSAGIRIGELVFIHFFFLAEPLLKLAFQSVAADSID